MNCAERPDCRHNPHDRHSNLLVVRWSDREICDDRASCNVEFQSALKLFFDGTTDVTQTLLEEPPVAATPAAADEHHALASTDKPLPAVPRTVLICHAGDLLNRQGLARWLASTTTLAAVVVIEEDSGRMRQRIRREIKRVGWLRFADVLAFRLYYRLFMARRDREWEERMLMQLCSRYPAVSSSTIFLHVSSPNELRVEAMLRDFSPDIVIARCKSLLKESVFSIPRAGTFVMHPGICPQYRNAHGCFWALAKNDRDNVGMTLLKIDRGVDTGPVYGYFRSSFDEHQESHHVIQHKVVFDNLDAIRDRLLEIHRGTAQPMETAGKPSGEWGQPWLSAWWRYRSR
jgi:hypothetical protein